MLTFPKTFECTIRTLNIRINHQTVETKIMQKKTRRWKTEKMNADFRFYVLLLLKVFGKSKVCIYKDFFMFSYYFQVDCCCLKTIKGC